MSPIVSWTDDFTIDHFATGDARYDDTGSNAVFTASGGALTIPHVQPHSGVLAWIDRTNGSVFLPITVTLTIEQSAGDQTVFLTDDPVMQDSIVQGNPESLMQALVTIIGTFGEHLAQWPLTPGASVGNRYTLTLTMQASGEVQFSVASEPSGEPFYEVTYFLTGVELSDLLAAPLYPGAFVHAVAGSDVIVTEWSYVMGEESHHPPAGATMTIGATPRSIPADGVSTSDVTVYVRDHTGAGVAGLDLTMTPAAHLGSVTDNGDGTYDSTFTSDTNPGSVEVQAASGDLRATTSIRQWADQGDIQAGPHQVGILRP